MRIVILLTMQIIFARALFCSHAKRAVALSFAAEVLAFSTPVLASEAANQLVRTAAVTMDVAINREEAGTISIDIYGNEAPAASRQFLSLCTGENSFGSQEHPLAYSGVQANKIMKDKEIEFGKFVGGANQRQETFMSNSGVVRLRNIDLGESARFRDVNNLKHHRGSVSLPVGGGSFEFDISPSDDNAFLDKKGNVVIGQISQGIDLVERMNILPTSKEDALGSKKGFSGAGKGFDPRAKLASLNKPLQRVQVTACRVEENASLSNFLNSR